MVGPANKAEAPANKAEVETAANLDNQVRAQVHKVKDPTLALKAIDLTLPKATSQKIADQPRIENNQKT